MIELLIPEAKRIKTGSHEAMSFEIPFHMVKIWDALVHECFIKHADHYRVMVSSPRRIRKTGPGSQSAHFHGHCGQIAGELGYTTDQMKYILKCEAGSMGYPSTIYKGLTIPMSESQATVEQESMLIETCHRVAAENGIILREE